MTGMELRKRKCICMASSRSASKEVTRTAGLIVEEAMLEMELLDHEGCSPRSPNYYSRDVEVEKRPCDTSVIF